MDFVRPLQAVIPGAQGRILAVLAQTTAELNLRTVARLAGVSAAQASRVLPTLVELGLVERQEVPPSSLFGLNRENVAAQWVIELSRSHQLALDQIGAAVSHLVPSPTSVIIFGSFARREADKYSDIDVVVVRPGTVEEDDVGWGEGVEQFRRRVRSITGNPAEIIEICEADASGKLAGSQSLWADVAREGIVIHGRSVADLVGAVGV